MPWGCNSRGTTRGRASHKSGVHWATFRLHLDL
jgi:hypothetical protein